MLKQLCILGTLMLGCLGQQKVVLHDKKSTFFASSGNDRADLISSLKSAIGALNTPMPPAFNSLAKNVVATSSSDIKLTDMAGVDGVLASWNLPKEVASFLSNIKFAESVTYQTYRFALKTGASSLQEFVASGKNNGNSITMAFIKVNVQGTPIQQYVVTR